jgi:predicted porin
VQATYGRAGHGSGSSTALVGGIRSGGATSAWHANLGYEYSFSRRTRLQLFASRLANDDRAAYEFGSNSPGRLTGGKAKLLALGMRHSF